MPDIATFSRYLVEDLQYHFGVGAQKRADEIRQYLADAANGTSALRTLLMTELKSLV
jgi:hypothetical protein